MEAAGMADEAGPPREELEAALVHALKDPHCVC